MFYITNFWRFLLFMIDTTATNIFDSIYCFPVIFQTEQVFMLIWRWYFVAYPCLIYCWLRKLVSCTENQLRVDALRVTPITWIRLFMTITNSFRSLTIVTEISVRDCSSPKDWNLAQVPVHISGFSYLFAEILHHVFSE